MTLEQLLFVRNIIDNVRAVAKEYPDTKIRTANGRSYITPRDNIMGPSDGYGCLLGQGMRRLQDVKLNNLLESNPGLPIHELLSDEYDLDLEHPAVDWLGRVQGAQDNYVSWAGAVELADAQFPEVGGSGRYTPWIGVDLDGTLAQYRGWEGPAVIGAPILRMVATVKDYLQQGADVRIVTARVHPGDSLQSEIDAAISRQAIEEWCQAHIGVVLPITYEKDKGMITVFDDRATEVFRNTGAPVRTTLLEALSTLHTARTLFATALPKFNWGTSALDAEAIHALNTVPGQVDRMIARLEGYFEGEADAG